MCAILSLDLYNLQDNSDHFYVGSDRASSAFDYAVDIANIDEQDLSKPISESSSIPGFEIGTRFFARGRNKSEPNIFNL